jgi:hypothetical protein
VAPAGSTKHGSPLQPGPTTTKGGGPATSKGGINCEASANGHAHQFYNSDTPPTKSAPLIAPRQINFDHVSPPRVVVQPKDNVPPPPPPKSPIVHRNRSRALLPNMTPLYEPKVTPLMLNADTGRYHQCVRYHIPTSKTVQSQDEQLEFVGLCQAMDANNAMDLPICSVRLYMTWTHLRLYWS